MNKEHQHQGGAVTKEKKHDSDMDVRDDRQETDEGEGESNTQ